MMRCFAATLVAVGLVTMAGCAGTDRDARDTRGADPLRGFAHLVSGEWTTVLEAGTPLYETWRWEPGGRSLRVVGQGDMADGTVWREEQVFFVDPDSGVVRVRGSNSYREGRFEGTVVFGNGTAEALFALTQDGRTRRMVRRWRFEGLNRFETTLLEIIDGEGIVPLTSWTYTRTSHADLHADLARVHTRWHERAP